MLAAFLLPMFIAMVALAVDYGVIVSARQQLQNAADAGALSALLTLQKDPDKADQSGYESINGNLLLGRAIELDVGLDIEYGTWDPDSSTFTVIPRKSNVASSTDVSGTTIPDGATAVRVTLTRSQARSNGVGLFFAPIFGTEFAQLDVVAIASGTAGCSGFVGLDSVDLRNNLETDSYNSDDGDYDRWGSNRYENGDVCSNGPITLASGADVYGDAMGSSVTISQGSGATISGKQTSSPINRSYPSVDFTEASSNDNDTIEDPPHGDDYVRPNGDLIVDQGRHLTLQAGTYRFRDMLLRGGGSLTINGEVKIYIEKEMRFDNGTIANPSEIPKNFQLLVGEGPVNIQGGHELHGVIYAPVSPVTIANGSGFFGSIIGKSLSVAGGAGLHFDESLADDAAAGASPELVL